MQYDLFTEGIIEQTLPAIVNTPETLGVTPRYVLQQNIMSRGAQNLSATAQKLAAMAMALLPSDLSSLTASFTFGDFCNALGFERGGESFKIFHAAVNECMKSIISLETEPDEKGKKSWKKFTWFAMSEFNKDTEQATMVFSSELAEFLTALKWMYSKIDLKDIGELKGRYALHLFEMAMSYRSLAGKDGNGRGEWYFERSFPEETRFIMGVGDGEHKDNRDLKKNVIDGPLKEINQANIGVKIVPTTVKQKRRIVAIRFDCASEQRRTRGRKKDIEAPVLPEPDHRAEDEREEKELAHLRGIYPVEFAQLYQKALDSIPSIFKHTESSRIASQNKASLELRARHGLVK